MSQTWHLMRGDTCLGVLMLNRVDQPFFHCTFTAPAEFTPHRALFEAEAAALVEGSEAHEALAEEVEQLGLRLVEVPSGAVIDQPLIHISESEAWFRY